MKAPCIAFTGVACLALSACGPTGQARVDPATKGFGSAEVEWLGGRIRTYHSGLENDRAPVVIFVHGSPGSAAGWNKYLGDEDLRSNFRLIAYDRPGYGKSGGQWRALDEQIAALSAVIDSQSGPVTLVGHSMGGPIVLGACADRSAQVTRVVVLAGSVDPTLGPTRPLNAFLKSTRLQFLLPAKLRNSNEEVYALEGGLRKLESRLAGINVPVFVIQGKKDKLVPFTNVDYLQRMLEGAKVEVTVLEKEGHFLPWRQFPLIKDTLLK